MLDENLQNNDEYTVAARNFMEKFMHSQMCVRCGSMISRCKLCGRNVKYKIASTIRRPLKNLIYHMLNKHCKIKSASYDYYRVCTDYLWQGKIEKKVFLQNEMFVIDNPHIMLLRITDVKQLINKFSYEKREDPHFVFEMIGNSDDIFLATYCPAGEVYQRFAKIINESNFECVICGDEYDAGFPSAEVVAEHATTRHK